MKGLIEEIKKLGNIILVIDEATTSWAPATRGLHERRQHSRPP